MKNTIFSAMMLAGASELAQQSDTTFTILQNSNSSTFQETILIGSFDIGEINSTLYLFFKKENNVIALPIENFPAPMMVYPEKNHIRKQTDFMMTDRWKELPTK